MLVMVVIFYIAVKLKNESSVMQYITVFVVMLNIRVLVVMI